MLTEYTIPNTVTQIGNRTFMNCTSLSELSIPSSVTKIGTQAFYNVPHITYYGTASGSPWGAKSMN